MKSFKNLLCLVPLVVVLSACTPFKGAMEDQSGGTDLGDSEYTEFAAKGIKAPGLGDASKIGMQNVEERPLEVTPVPPGDMEMPPVPEWKQVAAGSFHTCAISARDGGSLWCWGLNDRGQIGPSVTNSSNKPVRLGSTEDWLYVTAGESHTCAIKGAERKLYCWGANGVGQLGDGTYVDKNRPTPVFGDEGWLTVDAGFSHTCAITASRGEIYCWGGNGAGQVGMDIEEYGFKVNTPRSLGSVINYHWKEVSAGGDHTCAITADDSYKPGTLWCWGGGGKGQLGMGTVATSYKVEAPMLLPEAAGLVNTWKHVTAGPSHTCGIKSDDTLWCWGDNVFSQLGDGTKVQRNIPAEVMAGSRWLDVSAGGEWTYDSFTCGIDKDYKLYCWGGNMFGQLGVVFKISSPMRGDFISTKPGFLNVPTDVRLKASAVSTGASHTCAIAEDGKLYCWGANTGGQLGDGTFDGKNVPTAVVVQRSMLDREPLRRIEGRPAIRD